MRLLLASLSFLAACAVGPEPAEPTAPAAPDATPPPPDASPVQTPSTLVLASGFDQACTRDDECVAVFEGNACDACRCANTAIRRDALPRYRAELGAFWSCHDPATCGGDCAAVIGDPAICVAGRCTLPAP